MKINIKRHERLGNVTVTLTISDDELESLSHVPLLSPRSKDNAKAFGLLNQKGGATDLLRTTVGTLALGDSYESEVKIVRELGEPLLPTKGKLIRTLGSSIVDSPASVIRTSTPLLPSGVQREPFKGLEEPMIGVVLLPEYGVEVSNKPSEST